MKIMIGIPFGRPAEFEAVRSLLQLASLRSDATFVFTMMQNSLVYDAREYIVQELLKSDCEYLFFVDNDMTFDPRTPLLLARHKRDIVTAKAFKRVAPYQPCFYTRVGIGDNGKPYMEIPLAYGEGLLPIEGCGMACCLIHRSVFERVPEPWFFPMREFGEDLAFCYRARQAGVEMFCDTTIQCGHIGATQVMESDFRAYLERQKSAGRSPAEAMDA